MLKYEELNKHTVFKCVERNVNKIITHLSTLKIANQKQKVLIINAVSKRFFFEVEFQTFDKYVNLLTGT